MKLTFLEEQYHRPQSKLYQMDKNTGQTVEKNRISSYKNFTSHVEEYSNIEEMYAHMVRYAKKGCSLSNNHLARQLNNEPRKGSGDKFTPKDWVCLDFDSLRHIEDPDELLATIGIADVDYIIQYSGGHGIKPGLRAHFFVLLNRPVSEVELKNYLKHANLTIPALARSLELNAGKSGLRWALDVALAYFQRLIYIAPPGFENGVADPFAPGGAFQDTPRLKLVKRNERAFNIDQALRYIQPGDIETKQEDAVNELRSRLGLRKKKYTMKYDRKTNEYYQLNPDQAEVTGMRIDGNYVRLNFPGSDSWGYYHHLNNPEYIHNFKDEPVYRTEDICPEYYKEARALARNHASSESIEIDEKDKKPQYFVFTEAQTGKYFKVKWNPQTDARHFWPAKSRDQLQDFCTQYGAPFPDAIPQIETTFNPGTNKFLDAENNLINLYKPTVYKKLCKAKNAPEDVPPIIQKVVRHVTGDDPEAYKRFLHWLAYIWQIGEKPRIAWVFQGTTGTGKGTLFSKILTPLLGSNQCTKQNLSKLGSDSFNRFMRHSQIVFIDESDIEAVPQIKKIAAEMNTWITDKECWIREMRTDGYTGDTYVAFIIASNVWAIIRIAANDRRYNVAPRQERKLDEVLKPGEYGKIESELQGFADYLQKMVINEELATKPWDNAAKDLIIDATMNTPEELINILREGDLRGLVELLPDPETSDHLPPKKLIAAERFQETLTYIANHIRKDGPERIFVHRDRLSTIFEWAAGWDLPSGKFSRAMTKFGFRLKRTTIEGQPATGAYIDWNVADDVLHFILESNPNKGTVINIKSKRK